MNNRIISKEQSHPADGLTFTDSEKLSGNEFYEMVKSALSGRFGNGYDLQLQEIRKNNGMKYHGLAVRAADHYVAPVIGMDDMYQKYLDGMQLEPLLDGLLQLLGEGFERAKFDRSRVTDWQEAKKHLFLKVISTELNREILEDLPHKEILDLSVVAYVQMDSPEAETTASVQVTNELANMWGKDWETLYETAMRNTVHEGISFASISHVITSMLGDTEADFLLDDYLAMQESPLFVLTNHAKVFGAVFMVLPQVMEQVTDDMGGDVYVLPSSIHESLVIPVSRIEDPAPLHQLVCDVNQMQVPLAERLSDHVYHYCRENGLSIAA